MRKLDSVYLAIQSVRFIPHWIVCSRSPQKELIHQDLERWRQILRPKTTGVGGFRLFVDIMVFFPAFRNLFYSRLRNQSRISPKLLSILAKPQPLLDIDTRDCGGGLYIQHGYATIVAARKIGRNCWINQNVTLGYTNTTDAPTVGDNVTIGAGAKVLGNVCIGNHVIIGANSVIVKDVPDNCTVVGAGRIIRRNGIKINE